MVSNNHPKNIVFAIIIKKKIFFGIFPDMHLDGGMGLEVDSGESTNTVGIGIFSIGYQVKLMLYHSY